MIVPVWLLIALSAYICMAVSQLVDKFMLRAAFRESNTYAFLIGFLNFLALIMLPFGVGLPHSSLLLLALLGGAMFILALIPFLSALQGDDATRVIPLVGGLLPISTLIGEYLFLGTSLGPLDLFAFALLVIGSIVLTVSRSSSGRRSALAVIKAVVGAVLFSASFVIAKYVYANTSFVTGFFWMRMGGGLVALGLIWNCNVRRGLSSFWRENGMKIKIGYAANQGLNATGFILLNIAISLASVSLVNALQGTQYLFVILLVAIASRFKPQLLGERITKEVLIEKLTAVFIIITGIGLLAL